MKRIYSAAILAASLLTPAAGQKTGEPMMENGNSIDTIQTELSTEYGQLALKWEPVPEADRYLITAAGISADGSAEDYESQTATYEFLQALDLAAYACQEHGFPAAMHFRVDALQNGTVIASGTSTSFVPADYFPEKEERTIGEEIPLDSVSGFTWSGTGSAVNDSFHFDFSKGNPCRLNASWYDEEYQHREASITLDEEDWNKLLEFLSEGKLVRQYIMDPEMEILDGSFRTKKITWTNMEDRDSFYVFQPASEEEMNTWIYSLTKTSALSQYGPYIAVASSALLGLLLLGARAVFSGRRK